MTASHAPAWLRLAAGLLVPAALVLWWNAQGEAGGARALAFAPLDQVWTSLVELWRSGALPRDIAATLRRALAGLGLGTLAGIALGVAMALWRPVDRLVGPLFHSIRQVPLLGWLPLIGLWLGNGDAAKLLIVSLAAFYPTVLNSHEGMAQTEARHVDVGRIFGFSALQRFWLIQLPSAMPLILTGIAQAIAFAWIATIGTEILLGSGAGLGSTMAVAQAQARMDIILVAILATAILGFSINTSFARLRRRLLRWQGASL